MLTYSWAGSNKDRIEKTDKRNGAREMEGRKGGSEEGREGGQKQHKHALVPGH